MTGNKRSLSTNTTPKAKRTKKSQEQWMKLDEFFTSPRKSQDLRFEDSEDGELELAKQLSLMEEAGPSKPFRASHEIEDDRDTPEERPKIPKVQLTPSRLVNNAFQSSASYENLSVDPLLFSVEKCPWTPPNAPTPYSFLAHALNELSQTRSRIAILNILTNTLRMIIGHDTDGVLPALYLLSNSISPPYVSVELGLGGSIITKAIQHVSGLTGPALRKLYNRTGDPGDVAFGAKLAVRTLIPHAPLLVKDVFSTLHAIANAKGQGSTRRKQELVEKLLVSAKGEETRYVTRTVCQHIRVGATRTSVLSAFSRALVLTAPKFSAEAYAQSPYFAKISGKKTITEMLDESERIIRRTFVQRPNFEDLVKAVMEGPLETLQARAPLAVGIPLHNMLGTPTRSLDEIYERLNGSPFTAEFKYDGQRAQVHASRVNGKVSVKIFSRHLEDMSEKYPDVCSLAHLLLTEAASDSFIIDAEIAAINPNSLDLLTFQELSNRPRKDVKLVGVKVAVCVFAFDLLYLDGKSILEEPFRERRHHLRSRFKPYIPHEIAVARFDHVESVESEQGRDAVEEFWQRAVEGRVEGLMIKLLDTALVTDIGNSKKSGSRRKPLPATYEPDKRTFAWLKLKKDYVTGLGDTLDLVPIGAWHGNGRKAKWWSPILLGVWDKTAEKLVGVCKCMSGFTDAFYISLNERYVEGSETCSRDSLWNAETGGLRPEVYFRPQEVWEIRGADITLSPVSVAAMGIISPNRGLSLRFPRFIKSREDKKIEDASTPEFLAGLWRTQENRGQAKGGADEGDLVDLSDEPMEDEEGELET